jgi:glyoxylase-like metal-dependent hydrolase (beta-lactamase superfamily II)
VKRVFSALGLVLLLLVVAAAIPLGLAHVQIRSIDPAIPPVSEIARLRPSGPGPVSIRWINTASQRIQHPAYFIEWADGRVFLLDAGMDREQARDFGAPMEVALGAGPIETHGSVAEQIGKEAVDAIDAIAFTHLHLDHTGGLIPICRARSREIDLFQASHQANEVNYTTQPGVDQIEEAGCARRHVVDGNTPTEIPGYPGLFLLSAGGHTPGSTVYVAVLPDRIFIFSGDLTNQKADALDNVPKPWVYSALIIPEATERLERLRRWLAELDAHAQLTLVVAHDLDAAVEDGLEKWKPR